MNSSTRISPRSSLQKPRMNSLLQLRKQSSSTTRLYRAPQASIRKEATPGLDENKKYSNTIRRRPGTSMSTSLRGNSSHILERQTSGLDHQSSESSLPHLDTLVPPLVGADEFTIRLHSSTDDMVTGLHSSESNLRRSRMSHEDASETMDESYRSQTTLPHRHTYNGAKSKKRYAKTPFGLSKIAQIAQVGVLVLLAWYVFDSHHKTKKHKVQIKEYDIEREHLLEQMMWIDQAAKKVHQQFADFDMQDLSKETKEELTSDLKVARHDLQKVQVRIQLNARDYIHERYGDKPLEAALNLGPEHGEERLLVALSDDTPHAAAVFLRQIDRGHWDQVVLSKSSSTAIDVRSSQATSSPMLEFVEPSVGCRDKGSVTLRQEEDHDVTYLSLRVNLEDGNPISDTEVCIGRAVRGVDVLQEAVES